jgi:hypothetical protein
METRAQPDRQSRLVWLIKRAAISRLIATLGILVMTAGLYVPVIARDEVMVGDPATRSTLTWTIWDTASTLIALLHLGRSLPIQLGLDAIYAILTLGGLALIPFLWRPLSKTGTVRLRWLSGAWLIVVTLLAVTGLLARWQPEHSSEVVSLGAPYLLSGIGVFLVGALLSSGALLPLLREPLPLSMPVAGPRTAWQWAAAITLTIGVVVWGVGFYLMPEAVTGNCPAIIFSVTQFAHGACAGLDSDQVLQAAASSDHNPVASLYIATGWRFEILVAAGCITALGGWAHQLSARTLMWLVAWPAVALGVALVALQGVGAAARQGFVLSISAGSDWRMACGMVVTFIGIGLVALGQLGLWREALRRKREARAEMLLRH